MKKQTQSNNELLTPAELAAHAMATAGGYSVGESVDLPLTDGAQDATASADPYDLFATAQDASATSAGASATSAGAAENPVRTDAKSSKKAKKSKKSKAAADNGKDAAATPAADAPKSTMDKIREFVGSDEDEPINLNFRSILMGEGLPRFFRRNWMFITIIVFFTCSYVTCRYMMAGAVIETKNLRQTLLDRRYKALTINSELMERTLSSRIEQNLSDSTIHTPTQRAFPLVVK